MRKIIVKDFVGDTINVKNQFERIDTEMKYFIASDIHGSAYWCRCMIEKYEQSKAEKMILLGDILYHGPRNDLPIEYNPKAVIEMLNLYKNKIYAVRGNCEAEVDQMVLDFPVLADYALLDINGLTIFATHGHKYSIDNLPPISKGEVLLHGHTHVLKAEKIEREELLYYRVNPGSISIPKEGNPNTYAVLEDDHFCIYDFEDHVIAELQVK